MATPVSNVSFKYTLVAPDGKTQQAKQGSFAGIAESRRWLVDTLLHGQPIGSTIKDLRQVTKAGKEIPLKDQHAFFTEAIEPRYAAPDESLEFHPGVESPAVQQAAREALQAKQEQENGEVPKMPDNNPQPVEARIAEVAKSSTPATPVAAAPATVASVPAAQGPQAGQKA